MSTTRLSPCRFQIPLQLNDGTSTPVEELLLIYQTLRRQFGFYTILGERDGMWEGQAEPSQWIELAIPQTRIPELREVVHAIGKRLGQKAMYFDAPPPSVEIMSIEESENDQPQSSVGEGG